jgi:O-methyltransferase
VLRQFVKPVLSKVGYRLVPVDSVVVCNPGRPELPGWFAGHGDGLLTMHRPAYLDDPAFLKVLDHLAGNKAFMAPGLDDYPVFRLYIVWQLAQACRSVPGDYVEFGTFRGGNAYAILASTQRCAREKRLFLYDAFMGIPEQGLTPNELKSGMAGRYKDTSVERVLQLLAPHAGRATLRPGFIPATLSDDGPGAIAFMHVDLNAAAPTRAALEWAHPRWSPGGVCVLDDFLWAGYEDQRRYVEDFFAARQLEIVGLPTGQGIVINR